MRKLKFAYLLAFAPVLMGAGDDYTSFQQSLTVTSALPECNTDEFLTYTGGGLICAGLAAGGAGYGGPADCKAMGQVLTYTMTGEIGAWTCIDKGKESLSASDITTINTKYQELVNMETQIRNLEMGMRTPAAKYCGVTAGMTNGRITSGTAVGIAAAAILCQGVAACGMGARMCSVYDMYHSAATGAITQQQTVPKSWVYMASWQFANRGQEPTAGLHDNCGSYTYSTHDRSWDGTAVAWAPQSNGEKVLKFISGDTDGLCSQTIPIACCK